MNKKKRLCILLLIVGLVVAAVGVVALFMGLWTGLVVILAGALLGLSGGAVQYTVKEHYNPLVEDVRHDIGEHINHHPEDVPLNPWDTITGNGEQSHGTQR